MVRYVRRSGCLGHPRVPPSRLSLRRPVLARSAQVPLQGSTTIFHTCWVGKAFSLPMQVNLGIAIFRLLLKCVALDLLKSERTTLLV